MLRVKSVGVMYKASFCLSKRSLITLYYSLLYPYLQYYNLNCIFMLQKRAVRNITKESFDAHTDPIFKNLKKLKFNCIYLFQLGKLMFQFKNGFY